MGPIRADEVSSTVGTSVREWGIQVENSSVLALYSFRQQGWRGGGSTHLPPGSIPRLGVICGLSLLVFYSAPRGFSPGTPVFPPPQKPSFDLI